MYVYIIIAVVFLGSIAALSMALRTKTNAIVSLQNEVKQRDEKIDMIRTELAELKAEMEADRKAAQTHSDLVQSAQNEYIEKVQIVTNDPAVVDWLDQPLPDAVLYNLSDRICQNTNNQTP